MEPGLSEKKNNNSTIKCLTCSAKAHSFCKCIVQDKLSDFSKISSQKKFKDGSYIFLQGEKNNYFMTSFHQSKHRNRYHSIMISEISMVFVTGLNNYKCLRLSILMHRAIGVLRINMKIQV